MIEIFKIKKHGPAHLCYKSQIPKSPSQNKKFTPYPHYIVHLSSLNCTDIVLGPGYLHGEVDKLLKIIEDELPFSLDD